MPALLRVLVVGGSGAFGRRLVERLLARTSATIVIAGRSWPRTQAAADRLRSEHPEREVSAVALDRDHVRPENLRDLGITHVVDAAGPFQGGDLHLARAAIAAGCHYLDLADGRDFVRRFAVLDREAREAGVVVITGASSTPALSHAVLDAITAGWRDVERVDIAIAPGNRAPRGRSVIEAILSYVGRPIAMLIDGRWQARSGWGDIVLAEMPGLGTRWLANCETPDLDLVPERFAGVRTVRFRAGLELSILHLGLWALGCLVRLRVLRDLVPLAPVLQRAADLMWSRGSDRGGMTVLAEGRDASGGPIRALWSLVAEQGDGPVIPVLPVVALLRAWPSHPPAEPGARSAAGLVPLESIEAEFRPFAITTRRASQRPGAESLIERAVGDDYGRLPPALRAVHDPSPERRLRGEAQIEGAHHPLSRTIAAVLGFPSSGRQPADVTIRRSGGGEVWIRRFGQARFASRISLGSRPGRLVERFGPFRLGLDIRVEAGGFTLTAVDWRLGRLPLPRVLCPRSQARASIDSQGRYVFDVPIDLPIIGRLVHYRGWLEIADLPDPQRAADEA